MELLDFKESDEIISKLLEENKILIFLKEFFF